MCCSPWGHKESDTAEATEHTRNLKITANHKRAYSVLVSLFIPPSPSPTVSTVSVPYVFISLTALQIGSLVPSFYIPSVQFTSVAQSCLTLWDPMDCSTPGFLVQHQLPQFTQTHVHQAGDAIQPSHPLSSPSPPVLNFSQHQGLFK